jgi:hypothetical protein
VVTCGINRKNLNPARVEQAIRIQEEHHRNESFIDEYKRLLREADIVFDERYLE